MRWIGRIVIKMFVLLILINCLFYGVTLLESANILKIIEPQGFDEKVGHLYYRVRFQYVKTLQQHLNYLETRKK